MKKVLFPLLLWSQISIAQTGLWLDAGLSKKWAKTQSTGIDLGFRQNLGTGFDRLYIDLNHAAKVMDGVKLQAAYRLVLNEKGDQLQLSPNLLAHRYQLGFDFSILDAFDAGPKRLELSWSSTQQWTTQTGKRNSSIWRNKLSLSYDIKNFPLTPMFSAEHFYRWNANVTYTATDVIVSGATIQWRYFVGAQIELPKSHSMRLLVGLRERATGIQPLVRASYQYTIK
jgi:hypothetical protein